MLLKTVMEKRGPVLFVGGTGSGKSTSLAALIDHRNRNSGGHIITIEDPVEYVHRHKKSIINQREVGVDTRSFQAALKNTLRQAPDVILIGEIRDRETMEHALAFADTGHLAISTLHANNANQALDRIINFFPEERRPQLLNDLGNNLKAFVSQRLVKTVDGKRRAAVEVLLGTATISDIIKRGDFSLIKEVMEKSRTLGMPDLRPGADRAGPGRGDQRGGGDQERRFGEQRAPQAQAASRQPGDRRTLSPRRRRPHCSACAGQCLSGAQGCQCLGA